MARMGIREYARHRGVTQQAVQKAIATGRVAIEADADGAQFIDSDAADASWEQLTDKAMQRGRARDDDEAEDDDDESIPGATVDPNNPKGYASSHARREFFKAGLVELEYRTKAGELVSADDVKRETFRLFRLTREAVLGLPDRLAPELVGIKDVAAIYARLTEELTRALESIADAG